MEVFSEHLFPESFISHLEDGEALSKKVEKVRRKLSGEVDHYLEDLYHECWERGDSFLKRFYPEIYGTEKGEGKECDLSIILGIKLSKKDSDEMVLIPDALLESLKKKEG